MILLGVLIKSSQLSKTMLEQANMPIILCALAPRLQKIIAAAGFKELSLNKELAHILVKKEVSIRPQLVADEVINIVSSTQGPVLLTDYEMLFDPRYSLDVLRLFYELSRRRKIAIKWCGTLADKRLTYATPAHSDFHSYNIDDYDITCVI